jgi:hypothetical protein
MLDHPEIKIASDEARQFYNAAARLILCSFRTVVTASVYKVIIKDTIN